jgi:hypothetical protein
VSEPLLTETQIDRITGRATKFLGALSRNSKLRRILMSQGGYTADEHTQGWSLLLGVLGYRNPLPRNVPESSPAAAAVVELDLYDGPHFARAQSALERSFPAQEQYVFHGLSPKTGFASVGAVKIFVDRISALRTGSDPARAATREEDRAAAELLAQRRIIDTDSEAHLRGLIAQATELAAALEEQPKPAPDERQTSARALDAWLKEWRESARALITRRDYQIMLGLAQRRAGAGAEEEPDDAPTGGSSD